MSTDVTTDIPSPENQNIVWTEKTNETGQIYAVGLEQTSSSEDDNAELGSHAALLTNEEKSASIDIGFTADVHWPVSTDGSKGPIAVQGVDSIKSYLLEESFDSTSFRYVLTVFHDPIVYKPVKGLYKYTFYTEGGEGFILTGSTPYYQASIKYFSKSPTIVKVSGYYAGLDKTGRL